MPTDRPVAYVAPDLEPCRGFHLMMRAGPHMLLQRSDIRVAIVGGDGVSDGRRPPQGTWKVTLLAELGERINPKRVAFPGRVDYGTYLRLLQRSDD